MHRICAAPFLFSLHRQRKYAGSALYWGQPITQNRRIDTLIQQLCSTRRLDQTQWAALLRDAGAQDAERLAQAARAEAIAQFGKKIYIRGLIEFTNYCRNDCYYCNSW